MLIHTGSRLREIADAFEKSLERKEVYSKAQEVVISAINWENFSSLCLALFHVISIYEIYFNQ